MYTYIRMKKAATYLARLGVHKLDRLFIFTSGDYARVLKFGHEFWPNRDS